MLILKRGKSIGASAQSRVSVDVEGLVEPITTVMNTKVISRMGSCKVTCRRATET